ncbi:MAG: zinc ABC transporter substrate-binding protein [Granulosicoccus sp.]
MKQLIGVLSLCSTIFATTQSSIAAPVVLSDIAPTHSLVSMVMGEIGAPSLLIDSSNSPHDFSLRPSDARKLSNADIIFYTSSVLTPWLDDALTSLADGTPLVELVTTQGTTLLEFRDNNAFEHDHSHDHGHEHSADEHDSASTFDPHAWLDPSNAQVWLKRIANELAAIDPENADGYQTNALDAIERIEELSERVQQTISSINEHSYVVFHDSYHYFESHFNIHAVAAINLGDGTQPSISQITQLQALLKDTKTTCVFSEPQYSERLVNTITEGTSARRGVLDPLGISLSPGADLYSTLIESLSRELLRCLTSDDKS